MVPNIIDIPRYDAGGNVREDFLRTLSELGAGALVLTTVFWPPGHLEQGWFDWLYEVVSRAAKVAGPLVVAELPSESYDDIRERRPPEIVSAVSEFVDQVFLSDGTKLLDTRALHDALNVRGPELIAAKMHELGLVQETHLALRNGWHTDREIKFGSFGSVPGGDGFCRYLAARLARKFATRHPGLIVYWSDPIRHETLPRIMGEVEQQLARRGTYVQFLRLVGTADDPAMPGRPPRLDDRPVVLAADVVASTGQLRATYELLLDHGIYPDVIAPLVQFSFTPSMKFVDGIKVIKPAVVPARHWTSWEVCDQDGPAKPTETESRLPPESSDPDRYQLTKGSFWSMMLSDGRVGRRRDEDPRHLHHTYLEPGHDPVHMDALLAGVFREIMDLKFVIVHNDNGLCEAIGRRIKARCAGGPFMTYLARKVAGEWRLGSLRQAREDGLGAVVIDDGATTGLSLLHLCDALRELGVPVLALIVVEDKLDPAMRRAVAQLAKTSAWGAETRLFFLHRSPYVGPGFIEGICNTCEAQAIFGALAAERHHRPAFADAALENLRADVVWTSVKGSGPAGPFVELGHEYRISAQYNRLLAGHPALTAHLRMMDVAIRDALPVMRAEELEKSMADLELPWVERALLWLETDDVNNLRHALPEGPRIAMSLILQRVGTARRRDAFANALTELTTLADADPALGVERYQDMIEQVVRALVRRPDRLLWINAAVDAAADATSPSTSALNQDMQHLAQYLPSVASASGTLYEFYTKGQRVREGGLVEVNRLLDEVGWVLDLRQPPYTLKRRGAADLVLPTVDSICWAVTIFKGRRFTSELTRFLKQVGLQDASSKAQNQVDSVRRRADKNGAGAVRVDRQERDTTGKRSDHCLVRGADPGVVLWRDDGSFLWGALTTMAQPE